MSRREGKGDEREVRADEEAGRDPDHAPLGDMLGRMVRGVFDRGRNRLVQAATSGRTRLEIRQLQKDRDAFWIRLGKTAWRLSESGEIDHPAITKAMRRIDEIEDRIRDLERGTAGLDGGDGEE